LKIQINALIIIIDKKKHIKREKKNTFE